MILQPLLSETKFKDDILCLEFSEDGCYLAVGRMGTVTIYNILTGLKKDCGIPNFDSERGRVTSIVWLQSESNTRRLLLGLASGVVVQYGFSENREVSLHQSSLILAEWTCSEAKKEPGRPFRT